MIITLANVDQFSEFFHLLIHKKILCVYITKDFHLICNMLIYPVKVKIPKKCYWLWQRCTSTDYWHVSKGTLRTIQYLTVVRQTVSRLLTLTDCMTNILKFVRRRLESTTAEPYSVEHCCIMAIFSPWLSSHCLRSF